MNFVFYPDKLFYHTPRELGLDYYDVFIRTPDDVQVHGWFLRAKGPPKGTVFVLHGNGQNISAHITTISWLPFHNYHVFILDYRGYGDSTGKPGLPEVFLDIETGFSWLIKNREVQSMPIYLLGQSLGAALGVYFVGNNPDIKQHLTGIILDAGFTSYRTIAREKLAESWLTSLFQYIFPLFLSSEYDPKDYIAKISPLPILIMHSKKDKVIPFDQGREIFECAQYPKFFIETQGGHVETFQYDQYRRDALEFMLWAAGYRN